MGLINIQCQGCEKKEEFTGEKGKSWPRVEQFKSQHQGCGSGLIITHQKPNEVEARV